MSPYPVRPLEEVAGILRRSVSPATVDPATRYVGLEHIAGTTLRTDTTVGAAAVTSNKFAFPKGAVLYGKLRPNLGKVVLAGADGICSTDILPVVAEHGLDARFLFRFLSSHDTIVWATSRTSGVNLPRLSPRELATLPVPLPPLDEQRRIANVLERADALRAKRRETLASLDRLSQSVFVEMFGESQADAGNWPEVQLGDLLIGGPQNGLYKPAGLYGSGTSIVRIDSFQPGSELDPESLRRVAISEKERSTWSVRPGDILVNRVNSLTHLGKCCLVPAWHEPLVFESNMMRLTGDRSKVLPEFLVAMLGTPAIRAQILRLARTAVNQASINQTDVCGLRMILPPLPLQESFLTRREAIAKQWRSVRLAQVALDDLFASLQQRAFRGNLFDEPLPAELTSAG